MQLLPGWRQSYKWFSQQALGVIAVINSIALSLAPIFPKSAMVVAGASVATAVLGGIGNVIDQSVLPGPLNADPSAPPPEPMEHM